MNPRENYLTAMDHKIPEWVPIYTRPERYNIGLNDWFEKGPAGGGKDGFGVDWTFDGFGAVPTVGEYVLDDITEWKDKLTFPDLDSIDWETKASKELEGFDRENQCLEYCMGNGPFERMMYLLGYENLACAFFEEPEACHEFLDAYADYRIKHINIVAKYYQPDFIAIF